MKKPKNCKHCDADGVLTDSPGGNVYVQCSRRCNPSKVVVNKNMKKAIEEWNANN